MNNIELATSIMAILISSASFWVAYQADDRSKKAERIKDLLGEKETVSFASLRLIREGFPKDVKERQLVIDAVLQASVLEGSDRARALLYRVIEDNRSGHRRELLDSLKRIRQTFENARKYNFTSEELDLGKGFMRLDAVQRVIEGVGFSKEPGHY